MVTPQKVKKFKDDLISVSDSIRGGKFTKEEYRKLRIALYSATKYIDQNVLIPASTMDTNKGK